MGLRLARELPAGLSRWRHVTRRASQIVRSHRRSAPAQLKLPPIQKRALVEWRARVGVEAHEVPLVRSRSS
jgi:hypothetical protein